MRRIIVSDRRDSPLFELSESDVFEVVRREQINGENALTITTSRILEQGQRVLLQDDRGDWFEYVVFGIDSMHDSGMRPVGTYYCTWSLQPDLMGTRVSRQPGVQTPVSADVALDAALSGTRRWISGIVTNMATGGASMYDTDGWSALSTMLENWGGEIRPSIEVGSSGVTGRKLNYHRAIGYSTARRRFDFGADMASIRRKIADGPLYCRITPRGKGEETEGGGHGRKITIASVNDGKDYLENPAMVELAKLPDGIGGWEYPTVEVENSDCETPEQLLAWAQTVVDDYTLPQITYEVDVIQLAREGIDAQGVSLGDAVHIVDRKFGDGLRLTGRVTAMVVDELSGRTASLTIGYIGQTLASMFSSLSSQVRTLSDTVQAMNGGTFSTADYLEHLIERINQEINATGGYTYIKPGQGIWVYDRAEDENPTQVVRIMGGSISIADTKTAQGDWVWQTLLTGSDGILASAVTAANIVSGWVGSADASGEWTGTGNYINFDTGECHLASTATVGNRTIVQVAQDAAVASQTQEQIFKTLTGASSIADQSKGLYIYNGQLYVNASLIQAGILQVLDALDNVLFKADMNTNDVRIAGFTVQKGSLYNGLNTLKGTANGVYIGTDGISTVGNQQRVMMSVGKLSFANLAHSVTGGLDISAAFEMNTSWEYGMRLFSSQLLGLECTRLLVRAPSGTWSRALNSTRKVIEVTTMSMSGSSSNLLTVKFDVVTDHIMRGLLVYGERTPGTPDPTQSINAVLTTKNYVDSKVSDATDDMATKTWANNRFLTSSDLSGYATQNWVTGKGYATETYVQTAVSQAGASYSYDSSTNTLTITA